MADAPVLVLANSIKGFADEHLWFLAVLNRSASSTS
jgi:hypothetical protein